MTTETNKLAEFSPAVRAILIREPAEVYHAKAIEFLSSHQLADYRKCPKLYQWKRLGLVREENKPAYMVGQAAHTLILEGREAFDAEFAVGGPVNPKTGEVYGSNTKAFAEWAATQGKPVISKEQRSLVEQMREGVLTHETAALLLMAGVAEAVVRTRYCGVDCQIRMDWLSPDPAVGIVDLKTCDDLTWFEADARRYEYAHQMAFYRAVLATALKQDVLSIPVHLVAIEKKEPFRCGVWKLGEEVLASAQKENEAAIKRLRESQQIGVWTTGYEQVRSFDWI